MMTKLTLTKASNPAESPGLFLQYANGQVEKLVGNDSKKTSYANQTEMCHDLLSWLGKYGEAAKPAKYSTLDYHISLLEVFDNLKYQKQMAKM